AEHSFMRLVMTLVVCSRLESIVGCKALNLLDKLDMLRSDHGHFVANFDQIPELDTYIDEMFNQWACKGYIMDSEITYTPKFRIKTENGYYSERSLHQFAVIHKDIMFLKKSYTEPELFMVYIPNACSNIHQMGTRRSITNYLALLLEP